METSEFLCVVLNMIVISMSKYFKPDSLTRRSTYMKRHNSLINIGVV